VDPLVSDALRNSLTLTGNHGDIDLRDGEVFLLATGPSPSELQIRAPHNVNAADTANTDQIHPGGGLGLNLTGAGYTVGVWDGGLVRNTHQEFGARVTQVDTGSLNFHATHVAGTIGAAGVSANAKGMATQVSLRSREWTDDFIEMNADAALIDVSNHSYGFVTGWSVFQASSFGFTTPTGLVDVWFEDRFLFSTEDTDFGKYTDPTSDLDQVLFDHSNLLSVWSAGNARGGAFVNASSDNRYVAWFTGDPGGIGFSTPGWYLVSNSGATSAPPAHGNSGTGYDTLSTVPNAKNSLVVGAISDITSDPYTSVQIATVGFSSYGPTDDGRIKPDVVGNGEALFSTFETSNTAYGTLSGTSMSSPSVAGTSVLLIEHFEDKFPTTTPTSATTKGVLIHTAADGGPVGPDYGYGWGLVNAAAAATFITDAAAGGGYSHLAQQTYSGSEFTLNVNGGAQPLKATIVWTDPAGAPQAPGLDVATPVLVNDLDLWVTGPGGTFFPWKLDGSDPTSLATRDSANHVDNVEQVLIDAPASGTYTIHVGHSGASFTRPYTLLLSGASLGPDTTPPTVANRTPAPGSAVNGPALNVDITFSETVLGVDVSDLELSGPAAASATKAAPTNVGGNTWRFPISGLANGTLNLSLAPDANDIEDVAGNDVANLAWSYTVQGFGNSSPIVINSVGSATPYPSTINVSGLSGPITDVNVTLNNFRHTWPDDVDILLVGPAGQKVVLMSDVGGSIPVTNLSLTLDDAASAMPDNAALSSGAFRPTNFGGGDVFAPPAPAEPYAP
jgi:hypothetical protein